MISMAATGHIPSAFESAHSMSRVVIPLSLLPLFHIKQAITKGAPEIPTPYGGLSTVVR